MNPEPRARGGGGHGAARRRDRRGPPWIAPLALSALVAGAAPATVESRPAVERSTLTVFAAASLAGAFAEIGAAFERGHPGVTVRFNFAGSQQLVAQIEQGAGADVLASADERWMTHLVTRGRIAGEARIFARNRLVVIVPRSNPARIGRISDLARRGTKLVLGAEAVPVGAYAREALSRLARAPGCPPDFTRRVLANVVSEEENVRSVVGKVQLGEADAGIVYRSDVTGSVAGRLRVLEIPEAFNAAASYPIATLRDSRHRGAADAFVAAVLAPEGQALLRRHGLVPVASAHP